MKNAIGSTWIFGLVISFTLIFSGFLVVAISYSKAYKLKNEMTTMIEKYEGLTASSSSVSKKGSIGIINDYLYNSGYSTTGTCQEGDYGVLSLQEDTLTEIGSSNLSQKYYYCVSVDTNKSSCETIFYVTLFYDFNLPVFGHLRQYSVSGSSNAIYNAYINNSQISCK